MGHETIAVIGEEEDVQERIFSILDVILKDSEVDPTLLVLIPSQSQVHEPNEQEDMTKVTKERIVQFVRESAGGGGGGGILPSSANLPQIEEEDTNVLTFYASSTGKRAFLDA